LKPEITILGSSSAIPTRERHPSSQILKINGSKIMIDCGEGTQSQLLKYGIRHTGIEFICISHLHGDHYFGLMGMLSTMNLMGRQTTLNIIGPPPLQSILEIQILHSGMTLKFDLKFYITSPNQFEKVVSSSNFEIYSLPLKHRIHCTGFIFREIGKQRHLLIDEVQKHNVPLDFYKEIKNGKDFIDANGNTIPNLSLTSDPDPSKSYAYCSDTIYDPEIVQYLSNIDLLYHESTYLSNMEDRAKMYFHSTAQQAAEIAKQANVKQLIIGHFSSRYELLEPLLLEAQTVFKNTALALEGTTFSIE
jgi:ribonuclease Z